MAIISSRPSVALVKTRWRKKGPRTLAERAALIGEVAGHLAATMENNQRDLLGPGDYRKPFIDALNARFGEYAEFECPGGEPSYACLRFFATKVSEAMASGDNKWVVEQMMDIEAPEMVRVVRKLIEQTVEAGPASRPHGRPG